MINGALSYANPAHSEVTDPGQLLSGLLGHDYSESGVEEAETALSQFRWTFVNYMLYSIGLYSCTCSGSATDSCDGACNTLGWAKAAAAAFNGLPDPGTNQSASATVPCCGGPTDLTQTLLGLDLPADSSVVTPDQLSLTVTLDPQQATLPLDSASLTDGTFAGLGITAALRKVYEDYKIGGAAVWVMPGFNVHCAAVSGAACQTIPILAGKNPSGKMAKWCTGGFPSPVTPEDDPPAIIASMLANNTSIEDAWSYCPPPAAGDKPLPILMPNIGTRGWTVAGTNGWDGTYLLVKSPATMTPAAYPNYDVFALMTDKTKILYATAASGGSPAFQWRLATSSGAAAYTGACPTSKPVAPVCNADPAICTVCKACCDRQEAQASPDECKKCNERAVLLGGCGAGGGVKSCDLLPALTWTEVATGNVVALTLAATVRPAVPTGTSYTVTGSAGNVFDGKYVKFSPASGQKLPPLPAWAQDAYVLQSATGGPTATPLLYAKGSGGPHWILGEVDLTTGTLNAASATNPIVWSFCATQCSTPPHAGWQGVAGGVAVTVTPNT